MGALSTSPLQPTCLGFSIFLHNLSYKLIQRLIRRSDGLHPKHGIMKYHQFFIDHVSDSDVVLDIGCGNGANAYDIAKKAKLVVAIDMNEQNIEYARTHHARENIRYVVGDATQFNFEVLGIEIFNKVVLSNVLEHIEDRVAFLSSLHGISKVILLRVPMLTRDWLTVYKKENGYEYRLDSSHFIEFTIESLRDELDKSGWRIDSHSVQFGELWGVLHARK